MLKAWLKMICAALVIWGFVKCIPLILNRFKIYREITEKSAQLGIENSALFYTEEKHTSVAEQKLKRQLATQED